MGTYGQYKTDPTLELGGIILDLGEAGKFKIARAGGANKRFAQKFQVLTKPYRRAIQTETLDEDTSSRLLREAYIDTVLLGWEGVSDPEGKPLDFNRANALQLLKDLPWLFEEVRRYAEDAAAYRQVTLQVDAGNSGPSSATP